MLSSPSIPHLRSIYSKWWHRNSQKLGGGGGGNTFIPINECQTGAPVRETKCRKYSKQQWVISLIYTKHLWSVIAAAFCMVGGGLFLLCSPAQAVRRGKENRWAEMGGDWELSYWCIHTNSSHDAETASGKLRTAVRLLFPHLSRICAGCTFWPTAFVRCTCTFQILPFQ